MKRYLHSSDSPNRGRQLGTWDRSRGRPRTYQVINLTRPACSRRGGGGLAGARAGRATVDTYGDKASKTDSLRAGPDTAIL